ncbi:hypothetical protein KXX33_002956 [Aspergillus fumigatus]|jgi:hypothetical protein|uniref:Uncharacterized protein n=3 Tax=Aspergillus fumigatus TaxID=746128 RepID=Q4WV98_ASPFU|nr:conserved hypothetical protein [Aspergillus fumigatus Af293]EDP51869.1 conserved hypothetical protein [Aspergillus fumigatus A1163]KAF4267408.1 hypothetical protein CNMCM8714_003533 [Aspergillus fumigatus]KMK59757.1 hypothetical protein Y699_00958 [Aspergillus fumigatus Z5]EAL91478.1 conserved hypothetical protein [Aspergillus fumigatus Af293]KAF4274160.1 hypothetical protein CNMCM8812_006034 [Aspergillus fumigatus]
MAIWPFGRKNKRHTIQLGAPDAANLKASYENGSTFVDSSVSRKPYRKQSKRQKNRHSQPIEDASSSFRDESSQGAVQPLYPSTFDREPSYSVKMLPKLPSKIDQAPEPYISHPGADHNQQSSLSRNGSLLKSKQNDKGPAVLKKKLSKRKAYEIAREQEIRLMASSPIDIPWRPGTLPGERVSVETRRAPRTHSRRSDRHLSDLSLPVRDSAASSVSDCSESYTFKVNSLAAWTPRPIIRYVEAPRSSAARSQKSAEVPGRKENALNFSISEEELYSKQRVDALADSLDASALRELLERDRRRKEKQRIEEQKRLRRRLQRRAERQRREEEQEDESQRQHSHAQGPSAINRGQAIVGKNAESTPDDTGTMCKNDETKIFLSGDTAGSWLRDASKERSRHTSFESVHVVGNLDDSSVTKLKLAERPSFTQSHDMGMSHTTLSPSPSRRGLSSPTSSQVYGVARESTSDVSRTVESERRLSDHSSTRGGALASLFRRSSSRLKRRYRERFQDQSSELSNTSHESFFKVPTQSSGPPPYSPPKPFLRSGVIKRSQSKFTEHFGDEPLSPPDSRLQSPEIPEEPSDQFGKENDTLNLHVESHYPIPGSESDLQDASKIPHRSWGDESLEDGADNVPLSQSLASIDSEGSWMSGQFLRRISQRRSNLIHRSTSLSHNHTEEGHEDSVKDDAMPQKEHFVRFESDHDDTEGPSSSVLDNQEKDSNVRASQDGTWHSEIARRPVVVNPTIRPKSNEGLLLRSIQSLSPISADEEVSPIEEHPSEHEYMHDEGCGQAC